MKIESSEIVMAASRDFFQKSTESETLEVWVGERGALEGRSTRDMTSISQSAMEAFDRYRTSEPVKVDGLEDTTGELYIMKMLLEAMTGDEIEVGEIAEHDSSEGGEIKSAEHPHHGDGGTPAGEEGPERVGWGMIYESHKSHYEKETTNFESQGVVRTADGREISFKLDMHMEREYATEEHISIKAGDALIDPLVINFGGSATELTDVKFSFDLNADGEEEDISFVRPGSGFLVFDKNSDGVVNDGSELFGPSTGSGFGELSAYDGDKNGWIDENDDIYTSLGLWTKDSQGNDTISALKSSNVGAIYLETAGTLFDIRDNANELKGRITDTGIYLKEDGNVASIQQIDIAV